MDGVFVQPVAVIRDDTDATKNNRVRVIVSEGRNREVRARWAAGRAAAGAGAVRALAACVP